MISGRHSSPKKSASLTPKLLHKCLIPKAKLLENYLEVNFKC